MRIGELLVRQGVLTESEVEVVLEEQMRRTEPFGSICERLFGVAPEVVEDAWVEQYTKLTGDLVPDFGECDPAVLDTVSPRQAWQFRIVPLRWDDGALVLATTRITCSGPAFRDERHSVPGVLPDRRSAHLAEGLERHYPMGAFGRRVVDGELEHLASNLASRHEDAA